MTTAPLTLTPKTTVHTLLKEYPFLLDFLADYHPEFKKLTNPVLRRTVGRMATLDTVAEQGNVPLNRLTDDIATEVEKRTGTRPPIADVADVETIDPARLAALHAIVKDLHAGKTVEEVKPRFEELIADVEATEIAAMEQKLIEGGVPDSEVKRLCDVHVQVFADALEGHEAVTAPAGHPMDTFQRENQALLQVTASLRKVAEAIGEPPDGAAWGRLKSALGDTVERLAEVDKHYLRKENQLFPFLEDHGVEGPSKVMWAIHDDIRALIKQARQTIAEDDAGLAVSTCLALAKMVDDMVTKEEKVLHPMAIDTLERRRVGAHPLRRGRHRLRLHRGRAGLAGGRAQAAAGARPERPGRRAGPAGFARRPPRPEHRRPQPRRAQPRARRPPHRLPVRGRARQGALLQRGAPHLPAQPGGDRAQGAELPSAGERAQGAADHRRVPRRREGHRRVLDRDAGQVPAHPLLRRARRGRATAAWWRPCRT